MVHNIKVINYVGDEITMELDKPEKSGFCLFNVTGIGPGKSEIRMTDVVTDDGGFYNSSRLPSRNIVLSIRYFANDKEDVEDLRQKSYKFFPVKKPLTLIITTNNRICEIEGYVESNEPVVFSKETHTQISIICPYPYFYDGSDKGLKETIFWGTFPLFQFPFTNNSLTEQKLTFGSILDIREEYIFYDGDAEIGLTIIIDVIGKVGTLILHNVLPRETMTIDANKLKNLTGSSLVQGDRIIISTTRGKRSITLLREGIATNILNVLEKGTDWPKLVKGNNLFAFEAESGAENVVIRIQNRKIFEGV